MGVVLRRADADSNLCVGQRRDVGEEGCAQFAGAEEENLCWFGGGVGWHCEGSCAVWVVALSGMGRAVTRRRN